MSHNESEMSYDSAKVRFRAKLIQTGPGACLIGKKSEMYSKVEMVNGVMMPLHQPSYCS